MLTPLLTTRITSEVEKQLTEMSTLSVCLVRNQEDSIWIIYSRPTRAIIQPPLAIIQPPRAIIQTLRAIIQPTRAIIQPPSAQIAASVGLTPVNFFKSSVHRDVGRPTLRFPL